MYPQSRKVEAALVPERREHFPAEKGEGGVWKARYYQLHCHLREEESAEFATSKYLITFEVFNTSKYLLIFTASKTKIKPQ
mmetsp:Transcript_5419/g.8846  ORF Transcript_5419/g.8846 Transcript_5419/m.8846 type:complete len:81 (-) Transcript_5419:463-705(-)